MMRPVYFLLIPIFCAGFARSAGQNPLYTALREPDWIEDAGAKDSGLSWCGFSRQYYMTTGWNASGIGTTYTSGTGESAVILVRDGIPGFSWEHLYLSHCRTIGEVGLLLQIRFSLITVTGQPPVFRTGGTIATVIPAGESLHLGFTVFDFPGFLFPHAAPARGDPTIRLQLWHTPGRQLDLMAAFDLSSSHPGPLTLGIRLNASDQLRLSGQFRVLPMGLSIGMDWRLKSTSIYIGLETSSHLGLTPLIIAEGPITGNRQPATGN
jgi:hypothetical protein